MSVGCDVFPVREAEEGNISFRWDGLSEYEQLAAKTFEEGIENSLINLPPSMHVDFTEDEKDVRIMLMLDALGDGCGAPSWSFSLMQAFARSKVDCNPED